MIWLKACPRCRGDVYPEKDVFETNLKCLQCGHVLSEADKKKAELAAQARPAAPTTPNGTPGRRAA